MIPENNNSRPSQNPEPTNTHPTVFSVENTDFITVINRLPFDWDNLVYLDVPIGQPIKDVCGRQCYAADIGVIPAGSSVSVEIRDLPADLSLKFDYDEALKTVHTRFITVIFDDDGSISSLIYNKSGRELHRPDGTPFNKFRLSDGRVEFLGRKLTTCGAYQLRMRSEFAIGDSSHLTQDIIFNAKSARIDFHTRIDINNWHGVLDACFDTALVSPALDNAANHIFPELSAISGITPSWTNLSECDFGVSLLGADGCEITADGAAMRILLHSDSCSPASDTGSIREIIYSLVLHEGAPNYDAASRQAYMLSCPPAIVRGRL